jgi:hypothetical protein
MLAFWQHRPKTRIQSAKLRISFTQQPCPFPPPYICSQCRGGKWWFVSIAISNNISFPRSPDLQQVGAKIALVFEKRQWHKIAVMQLERKWRFMSIAISNIISLSHTLLIYSGRGENCSGSCKETLTIVVSICNICIKGTFSQKSV